MSDDVIDAEDAVRQLTQYQIAGYELGETSDQEMAIATAVVHKARGGNDAKRLLLDYVTRIRRLGLPSAIALMAEGSALGIDVRAILEARRRDTIGNISATR